MFTGDQAKDLLNRVFEQEALVIGGLSATGAMEDELVWRLIRSLDSIRRESLRSLVMPGDSSDPGNGDRPSQPERHPAVEEFLLKIRRS